MPFTMWIRRNPRTHILDGKALWCQLANTVDRSRLSVDKWDVQNSWTDQDAFGGRLMWSKGAMHWIGGCTLAPPGKYDGFIFAAAVMWPEATMFFQTLFWFTMNKCWFLEFNVNFPGFSGIFLGKVIIEKLQLGVVTPTLLYCKSVSHQYFWLCKTPAIVNTVTLICYTFGLFTGGKNK